LSPPFRKEYSIKEGVNQQNYGVKTLGVSAIMRAPTILGFALRDAEGEGGVPPLLRFRNTRRFFLFNDYT
jgi:hypothetical protein